MVEIGGDGVDGEGIGGEFSDGLCDGDVRGGRNDGGEASTQPETVEEGGESS